MSKRYIPAGIRRQIQETSRERCCICGNVLSEEEVTEDLSDKFIDLHHIKYLSEEGKNTEDNIIVIDANCHRKIHARPELYPPEKLKEAKNHWRKMKELIPPNLRYNDDDWSFNSSEKKITIKFEIQSLNLLYLIEIPENCTIKRLLRFLREHVVRPLVLYSRISPFSLPFEKYNLDTMRLTLKYQPFSVLHNDLLINEVGLSPEDIFIVKADMEMVYLQIQNHNAELGKIILTWGNTPSTLRSFFEVLQKGWLVNIFDDHPGRLDELPFAEIKKKVIDGFGCEIVSFKLLSNGFYRLSVENVSKEISLSCSNAKIEVIFGEERYEFYCPPNGDGNWWHVFNIDAEKRRIFPINNIANDHPFIILP
jgi:hypothetical protein